VGRQKLKRFETNSQRENVVEPGKDIFLKIKGQWRAYFKNENPLVLEVGCGRGEYTTGLAALFPQKNFVGIDIKGSRIWKGSTIAFENNYTNAAFLRTKIQNIEDFFEKGEVNEIWITFPDPRPKDKDERRRLTNPRFLQIYKNLMGSGGIVNFKTDNKSLFEYTLELLQNHEIPICDLVYTKDLYNSELQEDHFGIQTTYERKFLPVVKTINYLKFRFA
jgi:tRNA (guanine-N7-)-methyltransferase